jgi:hypothetical protein
MAGPAAEPGTVYAVVFKAQGDEDDLTLIYTADGQPCGVVSASKITPVTAAEIARMQEAGVVILDAGMGPVNAGGSTGLGLPRRPVSFRLRQSRSPEVSRRVVSPIPSFRPQDDVSTLRGEAA